MSKLKVIDKKSEKSINSERLFLSKLHHPFIVNMHYAFQDNDNLYLIIDLLNGGDLRYHISRHKKFSEEQTRFFISCIILALEYIHGNNVIHRDIKPENLVLDNKGYLALTDFGIAKENQKDNSSETSGTPGYMSPEVMKGGNHSFPVDFFAIGVIGYEFMEGIRPYIGKNRKEIKEQMLSRQAKIKEDELSKGWSKECINFINYLLIRRPEKRLGFKGIYELKEHSWLKYYPWEQLEKKKLPSPFEPEKKDNFDKRYCESVDRIGEDTKLRYEEIILEQNYQKEFINFKYNKDEEEEQKRILMEKEKEKKKQMELEKKIEKDKEKDRQRNKYKNFINKLSFNIDSNLNSCNNVTINKKSSLHNQFKEDSNKINKRNKNNNYHTLNISNFNNISNSLININFPMSSIKRKKMNKCISTNSLFHKTLSPNKNKNDLKEKYNIYKIKKNKEYEYNISSFLNQDDNKNQNFINLLLKNEKKNINNKFKRSSSQIYKKNINMNNLFDKFSHYYKNNSNNNLINNLKFLNKKIFLNKQINRVSSVTSLMNRNEKQYLFNKYKEDSIPSISIKKKENNM